MPTQQFLSFSLAGLDYGLHVAKVRALTVLGALGRVTSGGRPVDGVAVSRGVVIPLVDMRVAFGTRPDAPGPATRVIILNLSSRTMGMVVDGVNGTVTLSPEQIVPVDGVAESGADYLIGVARTGMQRLVLVDIERLMSVRGPAPAQRVAQGGLNLGPRLRGDDVRPRSLPAAPAIPTTPLPGCQGRA
jgi:purine-binding chemotaxis protein CheW